MLYTFNENNWINIPNDLACLSRWIVWKYVNKKYFDGIYRITKVPISAVTHANFKRIENECLTLNEIAKVYKAYKGDDKWAGVGFSSHGTENVLVLDFDECLEDSKIKSNLLKDFIYQLNSYTEISPSGKGIRIFVKYKTREKIFYSFQVISNRGVDLCKNFGCKGIEIWNKNKFATVTGNLFDLNLNKLNTNNLFVEEFVSKCNKTLEEFLESIKSLPRRKRKEKVNIEDCAHFSEEENYWNDEEEHYSLYNDDEYEDPFEYVNSKSLKDGTYQDNTPLT